MKKYYTSEHCALMCLMKLFQRCPFVPIVLLRSLFISGLKSVLRPAAHLANEFICFRLGRISSKCLIFLISFLFLEFSLIWRELLLMLETLLHTLAGFMGLDYSALDPDMPRVDTNRVSLCCLHDPVRPRVNIVKYNYAYFSIIYLLYELNIQILCTYLYAYTYVYLHTHSIHIHIIPSIVWMENSYFTETYA